MGLKDYLDSAGDAIKWAGHSSSRLGGGAVLKGNRAVRGGGFPAVRHYLGGPKRRERIGQCLWIVGKFAAQESIKSVPGGGLILKAVAEGLKEEQFVGFPFMARGNQGAVEELSKDLKETQSCLRELNDKYSKILQEIDEMKSGKKFSDSGNLSLHSGAVAAQKPEDVLNAFMVKGFKGADFLHALLVPKMVGWDKKP